MKRQILIGLISFSSVLTMNGQTRVPNDGVSPIWYNQGNVGIGTNIPNSKLVIWEGVDASSMNSTGLGFNRNVLDGQIFNGSRSAWQLQSRDDRFTLEGFNGAVPNPLTILKYGQVGIGTLTPNARLDLGSGYGANGAKLLFYNDDPSSELSGTKSGIYLDNFGPNNVNIVFPEFSNYPGLFTISAKNTSGTTLNPYFSIVGLTGNTGIGTTNPYAAKLHVNKSVSGGVGGSVLITNTASANIGNRARLGFDLIGFEDNIPTAAIDGRLSNTNGATDLIFNVYDGSGSVANYERMRVVGNNGYVGIGTTSPNARLDLGSGYGASGAKLLFYNDDSSGELAGTKCGIYMDRFSLSNNNTYVFPTHPANPGSFIIASKNTSNTTLIPRVTVLGESGFMGIGTIAPQYKLDVIGTIRAREIIVNLNGADFVFEKDYTLMPLNELEKFVRDQKHLPEIAPAKEMENGTDLGNLNAKLLQKIEELTLYTIEQNKELQKLKKEVEDLKAAAR